MTSTDKNIFNHSLQEVKMHNTALAASLLLIDCGDFNLFVPSNEVVSLAAPHELLVSSALNQACGYVKFSGDSYPVFCITKALQTQTTINTHHQAIVLLKAAQSLFAISCCAVTHVNSQSLFFYNVPLAMRSKKQPFTQFAIVDRKTVGLSSSEYLLAFLRLRGIALTSQQNNSMQPSVQGAM